MIKDAQEMSQEWTDHATGENHAAAAWDLAMMCLFHTRRWPGLTRTQQLYKLMAASRAHELLSIMARSAACLGLPELFKCVAMSGLEAGALDWTSVRMCCWQVSSGPEAETLSIFH